MAAASVNPLVAVLALHNLIGLGTDGSGPTSSERNLVVKPGPLSYSILFGFREHTIGRIQIDRIQIG